MRQNQKPKPSNNTTRDPDRTRRRILAAALAEFSAKGFAGARVDAIARRAKGNKRMLYHYFGNKEALFAAVIHHKIAERRAWASGLSTDPTERLPFWFKTTCHDPSWIRLLEWEALQGNEKRMIDERARCRAAAEYLECMRERQEAGQLTKEFSPALLALAMQGLTEFPVAFPQIVRVFTGKSVRDPEFQKEYEGFLRTFATVFHAKAPAARAHSH